MSTRAARSPGRSRTAESPRVAAGTPKRSPRRTLADDKAKEAKATPSKGRSAAAPATPARLTRQASKKAEETRQGLMMLLLALLAGAGGLMVHELGGPASALNAVKGAVGLGYPAVGLMDADKALKKRRFIPTMPAFKPAPSPPRAKALPSAPPSNAKRLPTLPTLPKPPDMSMALAPVKVVGRSTKGLRRKVGEFAKEALTNIKNVVIRRKSDDA